MTGQLTDIGGTSPLRLTFSVNGANRDLPSNEVARIVLARPNDGRHRRPTAPSIAPASGAGPDGLRAAGVDVHRADASRAARRLTFTATGEVQYRRRRRTSRRPGGSNERNDRQPAAERRRRRADRPHRQRPAVRGRNQTAHPGAGRRPAVPGRQRTIVRRQPGRIPGRRSSASAPHAGRTDLTSRVAGCSESRGCRRLHSARAHFGRTPGSFGR